MQLNANRRLIEQSQLFDLRVITQVFRLKTEEVQEIPKDTFKNEKCKMKNELNKKYYLTFPFIRFAYIHVRI
jgi:hypothetical protein